MAKKKKKAKKPNQVWKLYEAAKDAVTRKRKSCPKCGPGNAMAQHKDRTSCGKCGYTEMSKK